MNKPITKAQLIKGGDVIKQGHDFTLEFNLFDDVGSLVDLSMTSVNFKIAQMYGPVVSEGTAEVLGKGHIAITVADELGHGDMRLEFTATKDGVVSKFPAHDYVRLTITPSLDDLGTTGIKIVTVEQFQRQFDTLSTDVTKKSDTAISLADQAAEKSDVAVAKATQAEEVATGVRDQFDDVIAEAGSNNPEVVQARGGSVNLNARLDGFSSSLAEKASQSYVETLMSNITDGSPKELFYSINALTTKYPSGAVGPMLVFDSSHVDGAHSYIWDGVQWVDAGIYQSTGIADKSITPDKLTIMVESVNLFDGVYTPGVMAFSTNPDRLRFRNIIGDEGGRIAIIPIEANKTYTVKVHDPLNKSFFKVAIHNTKPVFGSYQDADTLVLNDDSKNEVTFTNTSLGRYLMIYVSITGQEPRIQVEEGTVATPYQSGLIVGKDYLNIRDLQLSQLSLAAQKELRKQALIEQARINNTPTVKLSLDGNLQDKVSGDFATYTGTAKTHPYTGATVPPNTPAYVGVTPKENAPYKILDTHATRRIGWAVNGDRVFGVDGYNLIYSDDFGKTIVYGHLFPSRLNGVWVSARGTVFVGTTDGTVESDASLANAKLYRSTDNGVTFTEVLGLLAGEVRNNCFTSHGDTIFIAEYGGRVLPNNSSHIYRSIDDGVSFEQVARLDTGHPLHIHFVRINPHNPSHIYSGTGDVDQSCAVWRSVDGGTTWNVVNGLIGNQDYRVTDVVFDKDVAYFGGDGFVDRDGYNRPGERFGMYELNLTNDTWTKTLDIHGPVYSMIRDAQGNIWASVMASADVSKTQSTDSANWTTILVLQQGKWHEVTKIRGLGVSGGIAQFSVHQTKGVFAVVGGISIAPLFGSLLFEHDAPYDKGVYTSTGDSLIYQSHSVLPSKFTAFLKVKSISNWADMPTGELRSILTFGEGESNYYNLTLTQQAVKTQRFWIRKSTPSTSFVTATTSNIAVNKNDVLVFGIRENDGELWIFVYHANSKKFTTSKVSASFTVPVSTIKIGHAFSTFEAFGNVASDFELYEYAMNDGEVMEKMVELAEGN